MNFKGRSCKRFKENSTNNLKKSRAIQQAEIKAKKKAEIKALKLKRKAEEIMEKKERPLPMTKEERAEWAKNLLSGMGIDREYVEDLAKKAPRIPSNPLIETAYGYKRVKEAL